MIAALPIVAKGIRKPNVLTSGGWINKMCCIHTVEYYSTIKRDEVLIDARTWMNLENIILSERSQTKRPHVI